MNSLLYVLGGTMFGTTPGGSKIVYDRLYLLKVRDSPASHVSSFSSTKFSKIPLFDLFLKSLNLKDYLRGWPVNRELSKGTDDRRQFLSRLEWCQT